MSRPTAYVHLAALALSIATFAFGLFGWLALRAGLS